MEWAPFVVRHEGPDWKVGYPNRGSSGPKRGDVKHNAEGWWPGIYSRLDGSDRASWHFTVGTDRTEQHYPVSSHTWSAGNIDANVNFVGIEHLGLAGQPLTEYQIAMTTRLSKWCAEQFGRSVFVRYPVPQDVLMPRLIWALVEHKEVSDQPTACPSGRIPWEEILRRLAPTGEDHVETYELVRPNNANWTYIAAKLGGRYLWKRYVPTQEELSAFRLIVGDVVVVAAAVVNNIPRIG